MNGQNVTIKEIWQKDDQTLGIGWTDGLESYFNVVALRRQCPCAVCVDEMSGQRKIKDDDISDQVRPVKLHSVGRYALTIEFSDRHKTGIYTFDYLRKLEAQTH